MVEKMNPVRGGARAGAASEKQTSLHQMPQSYYKSDAYYPGRQGPADMPADAHLADWPMNKMGQFPPLDDTVKGVQSTQTESYHKTKENLSWQH